MADKKKIRIKAAKGAPELVAHGNVSSVNENGYFETTDERFAEFIQRNYGVQEKAEEPADAGTPNKKGGSK